MPIIFEEAMADEATLAKQAAIVASVLGRVQGSVALPPNSSRRCLRSGVVHREGVSESDHVPPAVIDAHRSDRGSPGGGGLFSRATEHAVVLFSDSLLVCKSESRGRISVRSLISLRDLLASSPSGAPVTATHAADPLLTAISEHASLLARGAAPAALTVDPFAFELVTPDKTWVFRAANSADKAAWLAHLEIALRASVAESARLDGLWAHRVRLGTLHGAAARGDESTLQLLSLSTAEGVARVAADLGDGWEPEDLLAALNAASPSDAPMLARPADAVAAAPDPITSALVIATILATRSIESAQAESRSGPAAAGVEAFLAPAPVARAASAPVPASTSSSATSATSSRARGSTTPGSGSASPAVAVSAGAPHWHGRILADLPATARAQDTVDDTASEAASSAAEAPGSADSAAAAAAATASEEADGEDDDDEDLSALTTEEIVARRISRALLGAPLDVNSRDEDGRTALHIAAAGGHLGCLRSFLHAGADIAATDVDDRTPLHIAAEAGFLESVSLLAASGAPMGTDSRDLEGRTPLLAALHSADSTAIVRMIRVMTLHGASAGEVDLAGLSLLHHAVIRGLATAVPVLVDAGADPNQPLLESAPPAADGTASELDVHALFAAASSASSAAGRSSSMNRRPIQPGVDLGPGAGCGGLTPLHLACGAGLEGDAGTAAVLRANSPLATVTAVAASSWLGRVNPDIVSMLLGAGAHPNLRSGPGSHTSAPLHFLARRLASAASPTAASGSGTTPSDSVATSPGGSSVEVSSIAAAAASLVSNGARLDVVDDTGVTVEALLESTARGSSLLASLRAAQEAFAKRVGPTSPPPVALSSPVGTPADPPSEAAVAAMRVALDRALSAVRAAPARSTAQLVARLRLRAALTPFVRLPSRLMTAHHVVLPDEAVACCMLCASEFGFFNRRHHCRCCNLVVCNACSTKRFPMHPPGTDLFMVSGSVLTASTASTAPSAPWTAERVCDGCFARLSAAGASAAAEAAERARDVRAVISDHESSSKAAADARARQVLERQQLLQSSAYAQQFPSAVRRATGASAASAAASSSSSAAPASAAAAASGASTGAPTRSLAELRDAMAEARQRIHERGEKLDAMAEKSAALADSGKHFGDAAADLERVMERRSRFWGLF